MPESIPSNPNLEHLKKQAKALWRAFQHNKPDAVVRFSAITRKGAPGLSDAQHIIAREYGFTNWAALKDHVEARAAVGEEVIEEAKRAFLNDDTDAFRSVLERHPVLKARLNESVGAFDSPLITNVRSRAMLDVLVDAGADINARSDWWAGGFGLLECADPEVTAHAIDRGAIVTVHAAARLGKIKRLRRLLEDNHRLVHARGGDGQTPLHFASTVEIAALLLDHGAEIDARDVDHMSTPAQYMVRSRQNVARYLINRGCTTDILMAAALGNLDLVQHHLETDPESIRMRVSDEYFPMVGGENGGTIYQWELGWYVSATQVAKTFNHPDVFDVLRAQSPADEALINACWLHDESTVTSLLAKRPDLGASLPESLRRHVAHAARNNDTTAARLMLEAGLSPIGVASQDHGSALHWAAWHGNAELVRLILHHKPSLEDTNNAFNGTPLGWAIHGSEHSWERRKGDYAATVEALLDAGATSPEKAQGTRAVKAVLRKHGVE